MLNRYFRDSYRSRTQQFYLCEYLSFNHIAADDSVARAQAEALVDSRLHASWLNQLPDWMRTTYDENGYGVQGKRRHPSGN